MVGVQLIDCGLKLSSSVHWHEFCYQRKNFWLRRCVWSHQQGMSIGVNCALSGGILWFSDVVCLADVEGGLWN